jgi:hypothetical protein
VFLASFVVFSSLLAQEVLTNEAIVKLSKAGLGEDVIAGMINNQPGTYSLDSDSVVALKQAGVSDKIMSAMINRSSAPAVINATGSPVPTAGAGGMVLHDATPVRLRLNRNLSSAESKTGDTVDFEVLDEVKVGDTIVIPRGATAIGSVTDAEKKRRMARGGKLDVAIDSVRLVDGEKVALRGVKENSGGGHTGLMTGAIVATAIVAWPAAPFFLFMHGKDTMMPKGTEITAYVDGEIKLDGEKFRGK